jgi:hypothetical protein
MKILCSLLVTKRHKPSEYVDEAYCEQQDNVVHCTSQYSVMA